MSNPVELLHELAESCGRENDVGFWILTSAAAHIDPNYDWSGDTEGSTAEVLFWMRKRLKGEIWQEN